MLNREQAYTLAIAQKLKGKVSAQSNLFFQLPKELIRHISTFGQDDAEFSKALHHVAFGELETLKNVLEEAAKQVNKAKLKELLLLCGNIGTPQGIELQGKTLLGCAFEVGDPEMVGMIKSFFVGDKGAEFEGAEEELERQLKLYRPCIKAMVMEQPDDVDWLFDIIKKASAQDVVEELKTGDQYDWNYQGKRYATIRDGKSYVKTLREALNAWRQEKLDPSVRIIKKPRMYCNYQNWIHINKKCYSEHENLIFQDATNGSNFTKIDLVLRQLRGFIELTEFSAYERYAFARGEVKNHPESLDRSLMYKHGNGSFPKFDKTLIDSHSGLGFDFFVSIFGQVGSESWLPDWYQKRPFDFQDLCRTKTSDLQNFMRPHPKPKAGSCVIA